MQRGLRSYDRPSALGQLATPDATGALASCKIGRGKADRLYRFCRRRPTWFFPNFRHIAGLFPTPYTKIHPQDRYLPRLVVKGSKP